MKPATPTTLLPARVDSSVLAKFLRDGEPVIVVKLVGVGNSAPYDFRDKGTRSYIFRFDANQEGHLLRIPLHLWQENKAQLAHDIMDQRHMAHAMIVTLETPPVSAAQSLPHTTISGEQMGATDTSTDTRNVVGPGAEPTVAPTSCAGGAGDKGAAGEKTVAEQSLTVVDGCLPDSEAKPLPEGQRLDAGETTASQGQQLPATVKGSLPVHEAAYELVEPPKRLKALAALLGVAEAELRAAIGHQDSRIELAAAGWVRRKA